MSEVRLIDGNALAESDIAKIIDQYLYNQCNLTVGFAAALMPEIEAEPVRHGRWLNARISGDDFKKCSECECYIENTYFANDYNVRYCPNCGAKMDGGGLDVGSKTD